MTHEKVLGRELAGIEQSRYKFSTDPLQVGYRLLHKHFFCLFICISVHFDYIFVGLAIEGE